MDLELLKEMRQAIKKNDIEKVKKMVETHEGIINEVTVFGTFLHDAVKKGYFDMTKYLIESGIDINKRAGTRDASPLTDAASRGNLEMVEFLYENGAVLDVSSFSRNPLIAAIYGNHMAVVKFLVENGIDLSPCYGLGDYDNINVYDYAKIYGRTEIANYLKEHI